MMIVFYDRHETAPEPPTRPRIWSLVLIAIAIGLVLAVWILGGMPVGFPLGGSL